MRIVSLLPSATEIVCTLGLRDQLVGVTHECDFPASVRDLPKVTNTLIPDAASSDIDRLVRERVQSSRALYTLRMDVLRELRPDLFVTQTLCDVCAVGEDEVRSAVRRLPGGPVVIKLEPLSVDDVLVTIERVGGETGTADRARHVVHALRARVDRVCERTETRIAPQDRPRVVFLEWIDPPFTGGHWNPSLVDMAGGIDLLGSPDRPARSVEWDRIVQARPEVMFIACCGFDLDRTRQDIPILRSLPGWKDLPCARSGRVYVADGSAYFSRPGPRLVDSLEMIAHALHPDVHPLPDGVPPALAVGAH